jgi:hypothetical protein
VAYVITNPEYLEIDGVPLATPAWEATGLDDLWASPELRGTDLLVPMGDGVRPQRRRITVTKATIDLAIVGDTQPDGTAHISARAGLAANVDALRALCNPSTAAADGTRLAVLHMAPGAPQLTRTGRLHVLRLRIKRSGPNYATGQMELSMPYGALT